MSWNYRVCKKRIKLPSSLGNAKHIVYEIREAYYNKKNEIHSVSSKAESINGAESANDLKDYLIMMLVAFTEPIVNLDTLKFAKLDGEN